MPVQQTELLNNLDWERPQDHWVLPLTKSHLVRAFEKNNTINLMIRHSINLLLGRWSKSGGGGRK